MTPKSSFLAQSLLNLIFLNQPVTGLGTSLYVSLHTEDPSAVGLQTAYEASYSPYVRVAITRTASSWSVLGQTVTNLQTLAFTQCTTGAQILTHIGVGTSASGVGHLLYSGPLSTSVLGPFTASVDDTITVPGLTGLSLNDPVMFYAAFGSSLPSPIVEGTVYWVKTLSSNSMTVSATAGGTVLNLTSVGDGIAVRGQVLNASEGVIPEISANYLQISET